MVISMTSRICMKRPGLNPFNSNEYKIRGILTGVNLSSIKVAIMDIGYWSVRSSIKSGGDGVKGLDGGYHYFSQLRVSLYQS